MKRLAVAIAALGAMAAGLFARQAQGSVAPAPAPDASGGADPWGGDAVAPQQIDLGSWLSQALPEIATSAMPQLAPGQEDRNVAAFLRMIRAAEGTAPEGGYGALFGWPAAGRSFDPYTASGHPRVMFKYTDLSGKTVNTSPAGAYQITRTTWDSYYVPFVAWATVNGLSTTGFLPATQDAFAMFLLYRDGALSYVRAGRLAQAMPIAAKRWASLPGYAADNNPERTQRFVESSYKAAGGVIT